MSNKLAMLIAGALMALPGSSAFANAFVYVSNADSGTISRYILNEKSGALHYTGDTVAAKKVMPMAVSPYKKHLYAAIRSVPWSVMTWRVNAKTGELTPQATVPVTASYAYIATDKKGKYLFGASYDNDIINGYQIDKKGIATDIVTGTYKTGPHAHSVAIDNTNTRLYAGNLGVDHVITLNLSRQGALTPIGKGYIEADKNSGPRHSVISADNRFLYNLGEMSGTITQYSIDQTTGALARVNVWPSAVMEKYRLQPGVQRPANYNDPTPRVWAADIKITPNGHFLYVTERTTSTVTGYTIDRQNGALTFIGTWEVGKQPRGIAIDASGKWLIATGEKSDTVSSYAIDRKTGVLSLASRAPCGKDANWVSIIN